MQEKDYGFTGYNKKIVENARVLRKNMTPQEGKLWHSYLKSYPLKFYRQRVIDNFVADFYCSKAKLIIEIDGSQHYTVAGQEYDTMRTEILEKYGLKVIRFTNTDIDENLFIVCEMIDVEVKRRTNK